MITFIFASICSDARGAGPLLPLSSPLCARLRDEAEGMDDERGARTCVVVCSGGAMKNK